MRQRLVDAGNRYRTALRERSPPALTRKSRPHTRRSRVRIPPTDSISSYLALRSAAEGGDRFVIRSAGERNPG
jgi:hypothetical protein